jgi:hypothetical protein
MTRYLFDNEEGLAMVDRIDRRIDRLPGLDGLGLMRRALDTYRKIPITSAPATPRLPVAA